MPAYEIEKSVFVQAAPERVFEIVADFRTWTTWSPWLIAEPSATVTVSEDAASIGSLYSWQGQVTGQGEVEHKRLVRGQLVEEELRFIKPFKSTCKTSFKLTPEGSGTRLVWDMKGAMPWFMFWMIPMLKTFIGMDYQRGLNMLKEWIETGAIASKTIVHGTERVTAFRMAGIANKCKIDDVSQSMDQAFDQARAEFRKAGLSTDKGMISVYTKFHIKKATFDYISGYLLRDEDVVPVSSSLKTWALPACNAFRVEHIGAYRHLGNGWSVANQLCRHKKLKQQRIGTYEVYRTTPAEVQEQDVKTDIYLPLRK